MKKLQVYLDTSIINFLFATDAPEKNEAKKLSLVYLNAKAIRKSKPFDALHKALATIYRMDVLASWNFKDLANIRSEREIQLINNAQGFYNPLRICNPMGVC